ncbi:hypothetical protein [Actinokineospora cianjurensis]|uniref:ParB family chromosome partitioning protein n=1 Tax=Actinokineospora cianjurensis TaxID=585224 RepID=A0A421B237_9PSEU|nr:hypothetical protein [Actinokineospora cianjurensis]RLK58454.1 ParB family chromosome partitioning protein [Actinokineospora cianjurensis]
MATTEIAVEHIDTDIAPGDVASEQGNVETTTDAEQRPAVELRWVDPRTLVVGANTRKKPELPKWFVDDIADRGVREPISVREPAPGNLVVRKGQRRTFGAIEVWERALAKGTEPKHKLVPVLVEPELITDDVQAEIDRIIDQLGENEHRAPITDADEVYATQELLDLGLTAGQIARKRHIGTKRVKTVVEVARSTVAVEMLRTGIVENLAHAAVIAEFQDDEAAVETLTSAATTRPEQFDHVAQQLRDRREEIRLRGKITAQLTEQGVTIIERPSSLHDGKVRKLDDLRPSAESPSGTDLTAEDHKGCRGHAAFVANFGSWRPVAERFGAAYVCTDFKAHGHVSRYNSMTTGATSGPMTAEQKAKRKVVVTNNKAWRSAETVRRKWVRDFLGRKRAPKDGISWAVQMLAEGSHPVRKAMESDHALAIEMLGMPKPEFSAYHRREKHVISAAAENANPARSTTLLVALVVGALEKSTGTHTWRSPSSEAKAYFAQLESWGYSLSDVEQLVLKPEGKAALAGFDDEVDLDDEPEEDVEPENEDQGDLVDGGDAEVPEDVESTEVTETEAFEEYADDLAA